MEEIKGPSIESKGLNLVREIENKRRISYTLK